jgi:ferredoxin
VKVHADTDLCQGHAMCTLEAPDVFAFSPKVDETVRVLVEEPEESHRDAVQRAVRFCPTMALSVED